MSSLLIFTLIFLLGIVAGLRSLLAPAVVAWAAHLGWIDLHNTPLHFLGSTTAVAIFSLFAIAELIGDKLPKTPNRTAPLGLTARFLLGGLSGMALALVANQSGYVGAILGAVGGIVGAFVGYQVRSRLVKGLGMPDLLIALIEDAIAISGALFIVSRF